MENIEEVMKSFGFNPNELQSFNGESNLPLTFDPSGGIIGEKHPHQRGKYNAPKHSRGKDATLTIRVKNRSGVPLQLELFNAERSIVNVPNNSVYSQNPNTYVFKPFTSMSILNLVATVAHAVADESAVTVPALAIRNDFNGDFNFLAQELLSQYYTTPISVNSDAAPVDAFITCKDVPYASLIADIATGLVWHIKKIRYQVSDVAQFNNSLNLNRWKSFSGADTNSIDPIEGRDPMNNLGDIVDLHRQIYIDKMTGIFFQVEAGVTASFTLTINAFRNNGTAWN